MKRFFAKIADAIRKNKKTVITFSVILLGVIAVSAITAAILAAFGIITFEGGDMLFNEELFLTFKGEWYGWIFFILLQIVLSMLLCVLPGVSMAFIILSQTVLYPIAWQSFLLCFASVLVASTSMYLIGRFGGYPLCVKLLGEEDCEHALGLLRNKGTFFFPFMMLFPFFPDEALTMVAGTVKMKLSWFIPSIVVCRGIGAATIIFGMSIIPFDRFNSLYDWIILITVCFFWIKQLFKLANKADRYFEKKRRAEQEKLGGAVEQTLEESMNLDWSGIN